MLVDFPINSMVDLSSSLCDSLWLKIELELPFGDLT